jgi:hypothetical protein
MKAEIVNSGHGAVVPMAYVWLGNVLLIQGHRERARARLVNKRKKGNCHHLYPNPSRDQDIAITLLSNMEDGVWDPVWKIHEMVVDGQMT